MKTLLPFAGALAAAITLSVAVLAQEAGGPTPRISELARNGVGLLSKSVLGASGVFEAGTLATYDSNADAMLDPAEYEVLDRNVSGAGAIIDTEGVLDGADTVQ